MSVLHVDVDAFFCQVEVARRNHRQQHHQQQQQQQQQQQLRQQRQQRQYQKRLRYVQDEGDESHARFRAVVVEEEEADREKAAKHGADRHNHEQAQMLTCHTPVCVQQHQDIIAVSHAARRLGVYKHMTPRQARRVLLPRGGHVLHVFTERLSGRVSYRPYRRASKQVMDAIRSGLTKQDLLQVASIDEAYIKLGTSDTSTALRVAKAVQRACYSLTGYRVSVGVAHNMLLAKLASCQAKPFGIVCLRTTADATRVLQSTPPWKLPGLGPKKQLLQQANIASAAALQRLSQPEIANLLRVEASEAARVLEWCFGRDHRHVTRQGPPKSYGTHSSLTPVAKLEYDELGNPTGKMLNPVTIECRDVLMRFFQDMSVELLERIQEFPSQVPRTLTLHCRRHEVASEVARSVAFPSSVSLGRVMDESELAGNATKLAKTAWSLLRYLIKDPTQLITRVSLVATNMRKRPETRQLSHYFARSRSRKHGSSGDDGNGDDGTPPAKQPKCQPHQRQQQRQQQQQRLQQHKAPAPDADPSTAEEPVHDRQHQAIEMVMLPEEDREDHGNTAAAAAADDDDDDADDDDDSPFSDEHWRFDDEQLAHRVVPPQHLHL
ncbi:hypothetical protein PTSG_12635 [Salpingoeca rosetta]|uniref:UmuC domain-containing protein n=1 Tax=Salpingoeca rosetta (strain ATCC 50818 / BSB-021) TaxID=946362 RepID=F2UGA5_SALR5|nr:uncharacterized protein PTSG_12635 [Salpingoeca rosetta]EGD75655.1 hypothetical protein PTSG_12635 [Salpingoeca rosetta]|eukprot:XP_004991576.1 hypothetical protein PTSG_12635 [Salpingoeca rosetta]